MDRWRAGPVRSQRDFASLRGWRPGTDARLRSPAPFVAAGVVGALPPDGLKAVMPGICDGWDPIGDEFLRR